MTNIFGSKLQIFYENKLNELVVNQLINECSSKLEDIQEKLSSFNIGNTDLGKIQKLLTIFEGVKIYVDKIIKIIS